MKEASKCNLMKNSYTNDLSTYILWRVKIKTLYTYVQKCLCISSEIKLIINISDNFEQGQRRITRISDNITLLSSKVFASDIEGTEDTDESDRSNINILERATFSEKNNLNLQNTDTEEGISILRIYFKNICFIMLIYLWIYTLKVYFAFIENIVSSSSVESLVRCNDNTALGVMQQSKGKENIKRSIKATDESISSLKRPKVSNTCTGNNDIVVLYFFIISDYLSSCQLAVSVIQVKIST